MVMVVDCSDTIRLPLARECLWESGLLGSLRESAKLGRLRGLLIMASKSDRLPGGTSSAWEHCDPLSVLRPLDLERHLQCPVHCCRCSAMDPVEAVQAIGKAAREGLLTFFCCQ